MENDSSGFYYQKYEEPEDELLKDLNSSPKLMFHKIGTNQNEDVVAYENEDKLDGAGVLELLKIQILDFFQSQKEQMKK